MPLESLPPKEPLPRKKATRHILVFQLKLLADAIRDLLFSPISFLAFIYDLIVRPPVEESLSYRVMLLGRTTDRMINLFGEHTLEEGYTIDETVKDVEAALGRKLIEKMRERAKGKSTSSS